MVLSVCYFLVQNSSRLSIALFWICGSVVMPYMYSLLRYCWHLAIMFVARLVYPGLDHHFCSRGCLLWGMRSLQWWCRFHTPFLLGKMFRLWGICCKLVV